MKKRECWVENHIGMVPLNNGKVAMVDADRLSEVSKFNWSSNGKGYVTASIKSKTVHLHSFLYPELSVIDHINLNPIDNRSCNLREASHGQNLRNSPKHKDNTSGFKGVTWEKSSNKWGSKIMFQGKIYRLGLFNCLVKAAKAYDDKAKELFGEFYREDRQ